MGEEWHSIVTISRQLGSGGAYIGYRLAQALAYRYVDREILRLAAKHLHKDEHWLETYDERSSGIIANVLRAFSFGSPETLSYSSMEKPVYDKDLYKLECEIMQKIAARGPAVFIGRGGFYALKDFPGRIIRIFVHAPLEFRVQRYMKVQSITEAQARTQIEQSDQNRSRFLRDMTAVEWTDCRNYHLCIDTSQINPDLAISIILKLVQVR